MKSGFKNCEFADMKLTKSDVIRRGNNREEQISVERWLWFLETLAIFQLFSIFFFSNMVI